MSGTKRKKLTNSVYLGAWLLLVVGWLGIR